MKSRKEIIIFRHQEILKNVFLDFSFTMGELYKKVKKNYNCYKTFQRDIEWLLKNKYIISKKIFYNPSIKKKGCTKLILAKRLI